VVQLVDQSTHDPKSNSLNPATGNGRGKISKSISKAWLAVVVQFVDQSSHDPKINGLNPVRHQGSISSTCLLAAFLKVAISCA
jgi:hypothetical protein